MCVLTTLSTNIGRFEVLSMDDLLQKLENQVKNLIHERQALKQANSNLQQGKQVLNRERDALEHQQKKAITQIETLITRLKAIETIS